MTFTTVRQENDTLFTSSAVNLDFFLLCNALKVTENTMKSTDDTLRCV